VSRVSAFRFSGTVVDGFGYGFDSVLEFRALGCGAYVSGSRVAAVERMWHM
jgi:hypothetical protein